MADKKVIADDRWPRLAGACIRARDALRTSSAELSAALRDGEIPIPLARKILSTLQDHAGGLQAGLKHPKAVRPRRLHAVDLPPWMEQPE
jgi:hypothetical protein